MSAGANETTMRYSIDRLLRESDWVLPEGDGVVNVKVEKKNDAGKADYVLYDSKGFPICVLEAKRENKDPLSAKEQARDYAESLRCRFVILSNGFSHYFWDIENGHPNVITFFPTQKRLESIKAKFNPPRGKFEEIDFDYIAKSQLSNFKDDPDYKDPDKREYFRKKNKLRFLRDYQIKAVKAIQSAVAKKENRFLLEMATGTGKTLVSCAIIKMFLRHYKVKRVLFLVDRLELASQAKKEFEEVLGKDYKAIIWKENKDDWERAEIVVSTVQSFIHNQNYLRFFEYNDFDLVISDEAHRSLGKKSRKVFEYFMGFKLGLTATPKDFMKSIDIKELAGNDPRQLEKRLMADTYTTFDCYSGEPTFRYSLENGVKDKHLINPKVFDARTDITTELLSKKGYLFSGTDEEGKKYEVSFKEKDYEKKFFSGNTNKIFCQAFLEHALRDPYSQEIGKTLIFCVSQKHASRIVDDLNKLADKVFPNKYNSDFAVQITSDVNDAQKMTINFRNNSLIGESQIVPYYRTSKARVCVTVGMMTTGYDCSDILNICLMRPIYSPSEFIQMKGRGTRTFDFAECWTKKSEIPSHIESYKREYYLFDFFGSYEYFEKEFNYDEVLKIPQESSDGPDGPDGPPLLPIAGATSNISDPIRTIDILQIPDVGMRVDRELYTSFRDRMQNDEIIRGFVERQEFGKAEIYLNDNVWDKPTEYFTIERIREDLELDRHLTITELLLYIFGYINDLPSQQECLNEEFEKFYKIQKLDDSAYEDARQIFEAYASDEEFREIIDKRRFAELAVQQSTGNAFKNLPTELREVIPAYIKTIANIERLQNVR